MRYLLWELNVKAHPFEQRLAAAVAGRFDVLTLSYRAFRAEAKAGRSGAALARSAAESGVTLDFLDGVTSWTPIRYAAESGSFMRDAFDFSADEAFELCERTAMRNVVAIAGFANGSLPFSQQGDCFASFCARAARHGIEVHLEGMPILGGGIPTLAHAWDIVRAAAQPNAAVMFDTWHFMRSGADLDLLSSLPTGSIKYVQLVDGLLLPAQGDLTHDAFHHRMVPETGDLPLAYLMRVLQCQQDIVGVGPEAILDRLDAAPAREVGIEVGSATELTMVNAGFPARNINGRH